jgi:TRAP-type uncharacterized transport system substrate-binding protein
MKDMYKVFCDNYVEFHKDMGSEFVLNEEFNPKYVFNVIKALHENLKEFKGGSARETHVSRISVEED